MTSASMAKKNPLRQLALRVLEYTVPRRYLLIRRPARTAAVYLTFDDGPDPEQTPRILETLRQHGAKATFFVLGRQAQEHPQLLRQIADEGHAIGGHTWSHGRPEQVSSGQLLDEIRQTNGLLREVLGRDIRLFRPPYGKLSIGKLWRLGRAGQQIVLWNQDPKDFAAESAEELLQRVRGCSFSAGDILLLHDTSAVTAESLREIILHIRNSGFRLAALG